MCTMMTPMSFTCADLDVTSYYLPSLLHGTVLVFISMTLLQTPALVGNVVYGGRGGVAA